MRSIIDASDPAPLLFGVFGFGFILALDDSCSFLFDPLDVLWVNSVNVSFQIVSLDLYPHGTRS